MKLSTIIPALLMIFALSSCEKTIPEKVTNDEVKPIDRTFYFAPEIKPLQVSNGYNMEVSLEDVNVDGFFSINWGNDLEYYTLSVIPADSEVRLRKFFDGKDCLEIKEMDFNQRSNSFDLNIVENEKGTMSISMGDEILFENTQKSFSPEFGKYSTDGGLKVSQFRLR